MRRRCVRLEPEMNPARHPMDMGNSWVKDAALGAAGGLFAAWVMDLFMERELKAAERAGLKPVPQSSPRGEDPKAEAAQRVGTTVLSRPLTFEEKELAAPAVHYLMGAFLGGLYGALSGRVPLADG